MSQNMIKIYSILPAIGTTVHPLLLYNMTVAVRDVMRWCHADITVAVGQGVIDQLVQLRKRAGITAGSKIEILAADHDFYVARINDKWVTHPTLAVSLPCAPYLIL